MMRYIITILLMFVSILFISFRVKQQNKIVDTNVVATTIHEETTEEAIEEKADEEISKNYVSTTIRPADFVAYSKTLLGTPYLYGSVDPSKGLDCSGFINAVATHFGIKVPRSSVEFTNFGTVVDTTDAKPGDLILFTGTDPNKRIVGHMGIITENGEKDIQFIHSSSGKANGVTVSGLGGYYQTRFVKVIRILQDADGVAA